MKARKLRNIFAAKYLPLLEEVEVRERYWEKWWRGEKFEAYLFEIKPHPKSVSIWAIGFEDCEGERVLMRVSGVGEKVFRGDTMEEADWKIFYRLINKAVSKIIASAVAHLTGGAAFDRTISFPPKMGKEYRVYFSLTEVSLLKADNKELIKLRPSAGFIEKLAKVIQLSNL